MSYDAWSKRAPILHAMKFEELIERGLVMIGSPQTVAQQIIEHQRRLDHVCLGGRVQVRGNALRHDGRVDAPIFCGCHDQGSVRRSRHPPTKTQTTCRLTISSARTHSPARNNVSVAMKWIGYTVLVEKNSPYPFGHP